MKPLALIPCLLLASCTVYEPYQSAHPILMEQANRLRSMSQDINNEMQARIKLAGDVQSLRESVDRFQGTADLALDAAHAASEQSKSAEGKAAEAVASAAEAKPADTRTKIGADVGGATSALIVLGALAKLIQVQIRKRKASKATSQVGEIK